MRRRARAVATVSDKRLTPQARRLSSWSGGRVALHGPAGPTGQSMLSAGTSQRPAIYDSATRRATGTIWAVPPPVAPCFPYVAGQLLGDADGLADDEGDGLADGLALPASTRALRTRSRAAPWALA